MDKNILNVVIIIISIGLVAVFSTMAIDSYRVHMAQKLIEETTKALEKELSKATKEINNTRIHITSPPLINNTNKTSVRKNSENTSIQTRKVEGNNATVTESIKKKNCVFSDNKTVCIQE